jgi:short-subunit dehydrogenase
MGYWQDKVVLVTGGSAGFGKVIARSFAQRGSKVVIAARDALKLSGTAEEFCSAGLSATAFSADITQQDQVEVLFSKVIEQHGRLDVLVNNAGRSARGAALDTTAEQFRDLLDLNFLSLVRCTKAAAPHLIRSKGHLVNIGSLASKTASRYLGAYPASKFPVAAYSQQLRYELGPLGVHVLLVCPGPVRRDDAGQRYQQQSADLPESAGKPGGGVRLKGIDPEKLAAGILHACERRKTELVVPAAARLLFAISSLSPALGDWIIHKMT